MMNLIRELHRLRNQGGLNAILLAYSEDFIEHWPRGWRIAENCGHEKILDLVVSEDLVVSLYLPTGTHQGNFAGLVPTGSI